MGKEISFLIYCIERYRYFKGLSGEEAAVLFDEYDIYRYIIKYFETLHTMGDRALVEEIDEYIAARSGDRRGT